MPGLAGSTQLLGSSPRPPQGSKSCTENKICEGGLQDTGLGWARAPGDSAVAVTMMLAHCCLRVSCGHAGPLRPCLGLEPQVYTSTHSPKAMGEGWSCRQPPGGAGLCSPHLKFPPTRAVGLGEWQHGLAESEGHTCLASPWASGKPCPPPPRMSPVPSQKHCL